jgi:hypothetical protein
MLSILFSIEMRGNHMQKRNPCIRSLIIAIVFIIFPGFGFPSGAQEDTYQLLGYAVVPDVIKTIGTVEKIAIEIDPVKYRPNMLKMQIGILLGDPYLQKIDASRPVLAMLFNTPKMKAVNNKGYGREYGC